MKCRLSWLAAIDCARQKTLNSCVRFALFPATILLILFLLSAGCGQQNDSTSATAGPESKASSVSSSPKNQGIDRNHIASDASPPDKPVRLIFIHHSVGEDWLDDTKGGLGKALMDNNYFVSDTNYGWGPPDLDAGSENIGDHTDTGYWYSWFAGPHSSTYLSALYAESGQNTASPYSRLSQNPGGENEIVMFKSCFPNSNLGGSPNDPPAQGQNLLRGQPAGEEVQTVQNAKGIYNDLLGYFATRQDKLFIVVTAPPLIESETTPEAAANARALNSWLVNDWLAGYPHQNVAVFDFFNVLTSNGGSGNFSAYGSEDSHPTAAGEQKATAEFIKLLNADYHAWKNG